MKLKLFDYQKHGVRKIEEFGHRVLLADSMGLGKTIQSIVAIRKYGNKYKPIIVVCSSNVKYNWRKEVRIWGLGKLSARILSTRTPPERPPNFKERNSNKVYIINSEILPWWVDWLKKVKAETVIVDECFPKETLVLTNKGWKPIGDIVDQKLNVKVASFDFSNSAIEYRPIQHYIKIRRKNDLVTIHHASGELVCTDNHEVWSLDRGKYVQAKSLNRGEKMCLVQKEVQDSTIPKRQEKVLRNELFSEMENETTRNTVQGIHERSCKKTQPVNQKTLSNPKGVITEKTVFQTNAETQPEFRPQKSRKRETNKNKKGVVAHLERGKGRERKINKTADNSPSKTRDKLETRTTDKNPHDTEFGIPPVLQSRHRIEETSNCNRSRRFRAQDKKEIRFGQKERFLVTSSRVDRVTVHKQRSRKQAKQDGENHPFVYCLEVKKNHNFFAGGLLVSNCQRIKNRKTKTYKATKAICRGVPNVHMLSGTPLTNRPAELWPTLNILWPKAFPNFFEFCLEYAQPKRNHWGWTFDGAKNLPQLHALLRKHGMIRRKKEDVLKDLPPKTRTLIPVDLPPAAKKEYEKATKDFMRWLIGVAPGMKNKASRMIGLAKMTALIMLIARLKLPLVQTWIEDFLEQSDGKLVVFGEHHCVLEPLHEKFKKISVLVDGNCNAKEKERRNELFRTSKTCRINFSNMIANGSGSNLQVAADSLFAETGWTPGVVAQCEGRTDRIGQKSAVNYWYMVVKGSIEEKRCRVVQEKSEILDQVLDGAIQKGSLDIYSQLLKSLKKGSKK